MAELRYELKPGSLVIANDGSCGILQHLFLHREKLCVVAMIVKRDQPFTRPVVVPLTQVADATDGEVQLHISHSEVGVLPRFYPRCYGVAGKGRNYGLGKASGSSNGASSHITAQILLAHLGTPLQPCPIKNPQTPYLLVRKGQRVFCTDGRGGQLVSVQVQTSGRVRQLVVQRGRLLGGAVVVPLEQVQRFDPRGVYLKIKRAELAALPSYRCDREIAAALDQTFWNHDLLHELDHRAIAVNVRNGVVTLRGYVVRPSSREFAAKLAQELFGVRAVENQLVVDGEVVCAVAQALTRDPYTRGHPLEVHVERGFVYLSGAVPDAATRTAVAECVSSVPLVRGLVNLVTAPGVDLEAEDQRVFQPQIGQEVYGLDMALGHVERVVINPTDRRVTALVVHGHFPKVEAANQPHVIAGETRYDRRVVIPMLNVRTVTDGAVLLNVAGQTAARSADVATANLLTPGTEWQPPYPYRREVVLLVPTHVQPEAVTLAATEPAAGALLEYSVGARSRADVTV